MLTVNSISGGRTSAYMALHFPADINVFAVVRTRDKAYRSTDRGMLREIENRLPNFYASHEDDLTLKAVLDLEQRMGKAITWVGADFDLEDFCDGTTDLPGYRTGAPMLFNSRRRFCTVEQKILPIAKHLFMSSTDLDSPPSPVMMQIGFRADEPKRVENWNCKNDKVKIAVSSSLKTRKTTYLRYEWRVSDFPLYRAGITSQDVISFWDKESIKFPSISNCRLCPFHTDSQLQAQVASNPAIAEWYTKREALSGHSFGKRSLTERINKPDFRPGNGTSCQCTG